MQQEEDRTWYKNKIGNHKAPSSEKGKALLFKLDRQQNREIQVHDALKKH